MIRWCVVIGVLLAAVPARADEADDLVKQALDLYKAGNYAEAAKLYARANELQPKPETLFSLAQSERLSGDCKHATEHYHKVIEQVSDFNVARLVQQNLKLCGNEEDQQKPAQTTPPAPAPATVETKTVFRDRVHTDALGLTMLGAGMLALGASGGLYLAARADDRGAKAAFTLDDHDSLQDRAGTERVASLVALGAGVALVGVGVYRFASAHETTTNVAVAPTSGGGALVFSGRW